jgi:outer membrane protein assembly factor BamB
MRASRGLGTPIFADNALFLPDRFHLRKITPEGKELWAVKLPYTLNYTSAPAIADSIAVIAHADKIFAIDAGNGKILWSFKCRNSIEAGFGKNQIVRNGSSAAIADGKVFCGSDDGYLYVLDLKSGKKLQEIKTGSPIKASVAVAENFVCISDFDGRLYGFSIK